MTFEEFTVKQKELVVAETLLYNFVAQKFDDYLDLVETYKQHKEYFDELSFEIDCIFNRSDFYVHKIFYNTFEIFLHGGENIEEFPIELLFEDEDQMKQRIERKLNSKEYALYLKLKKKPKNVLTKLPKN